MFSKRGLVGSHLAEGLVAIMERDHLSSPLSIASGWLHVTALSVRVRWNQVQVSARHTVLLQAEQIEFQSHSQKAVLTSVELNGQACWDYPPPHYKSTTDLLGLINMDLNSACPFCLTVTSEWTYFSYFLQIFSLILFTSVLFSFLFVLIFRWV